jgi:uncharacterized protein DUF4129
MKRLTPACQQPCRLPYRYALAAALFCLLVGLAWAQNAPLLSVPEYVQELGRVREGVSELAAKPQTGPALENSLPKSWRVRTARGEVEVPTDLLRDGVERFLKAPPPQKAQCRKELDDSLALLQSAADAYESAEPVGADVHQRLDRILQAREFRGLRGPTPLQLLWQRLTSWLQQQLEKLFPNLPSASEAGPVFAWCVIAVVCCAFAIWLYRRSRHADLQLLQELVATTPSATGWRSWLAEARASAERGEWREAIHLAFWAAVAKLEAEGIWTPDRTRTPREYLRAIPEWNTARASFQSIMRSFERSWYGQRPASAEDFQQVLLALERMGCQ